MKELKIQKEKVVCQGINDNKNNIGWGERLLNIHKYLQNKFHMQEKSRL